MKDDHDEWAAFEDKAEVSGYTIIPNSIMRHPNLSMGAKYLYSLLKSYAWQDLKTYPGIKRICKDANASDKTLAKYLKELVAAKLLEVKRRGQGRTNLYVFKSLNNVRIPKQEPNPSPNPESDTPPKQEPNPSPNNEDAGNEDAVDEDSGSTPPYGEPKESAHGRGGNQSDSDDQGVEAWEYAEMLRSGLKDADIPLTRSRERRYVREFRLAMERGVEPEECDEALDRIVSEWGRVQLSVDMALRDCRNGCQTNGKALDGGGGDEAASQSATPPEVVEYIFANTKTESIRNNESSIRRAMRKHDFTKAEEPPFPVAKMLGGSENERWQVQDALESLCRRAVREHVA